MRRRWVALTAAGLATAVLAVGVGLVADRLTAGSPSPPALKSMTPAMLAQVHVTVKPAGQAPYCGLVAVPLQRGWLHGVTLGCAVSRQAAEEAAAAQQQGRIVESVLARVTLAPPLQGGQDELVWLVVVRPSAPGAAVLTEIFLVDAFTGHVTSTIDIVTVTPLPPSVAPALPIPRPTAEPIPKPTLETG